MFIVIMETGRKYGYIRKMNDDNGYENGWWTPPESFKTPFAVRLLIGITLLECLSRKWAW